MTDLKMRMILTVTTTIGSETSHEYSLPNDPVEASHVIIPLAKTLQTSMSKRIPLTLENPLVAYHGHHIVRVSITYDGPEDVKEEVERHIGFPTP